MHKNQFALFMVMLNMKELKRIKKSVSSIKNIKQPFDIKLNLIMIQMSQKIYPKVRIDGVIASKHKT